MKKYVINYIIIIFLFFKLSAFTLSLSYFDECKETCIYTDASPFGILAILLQKSTDDDYKVISYSSRALTETEQRYSQLERECLSIVYGCEKNRLYLLGRHFDIYNNHKALFHLINNPKSQIPLRIERMTLRLQHFNLHYITRKLKIISPIIPAVTQA